MALNAVVMRGIGIDPQVKAKYQSYWGVYFGEVSLGGFSALGGTSDLKMIDLERVEVFVALREPYLVQALLQALCEIFLMPLIK